VIDRTSGAKLVSLTIYIPLHIYVLHVLELLTEGFIFLSILALNQFIVAILIARIACARLY
jgi:uncharacterized membrane protein (DUF2068 family)